jgi:hypothetical protein
LRIVERLGITPTTGLEVAKSSYRYNPNEILELKNEFSEFEIWAITNSLIKHRNPRQRLERARTALQELKREYGVIPEGILVQVSLDTDKPHGFVLQLTEKVEKLKEKFPDMLENDLYGIAFSHRADTEDFIAKAQGQQIKLREKYPQTESWLIRRAVFEHPNDPEGFIEKTERVFITLQARYPHVQDTIIKKAAAGTKDPDGYIQRVMQLVPQLKAKYVDIPEYFIVYAASLFSEPRAYLDKVLLATPELEKQFPRFSRGNILRALYNYSDVNKFLTEAEGVIDNLQLKYSNIPYQVLASAAIYMPENPNKYIELNT